MEPNGIVDCAKQIWDNGDWMRKFISDDGSSSRCALHHPILTQIKKGYIDNWPLDKKKKCVKSTGEMPEEIHAVQTYLVDPSHRWRVYGANLLIVQRVLKTPCPSFSCRNPVLRLRAFLQGKPTKSSWPWWLCLEILTRAHALSPQQPSIHCAKHCLHCLNWILPRNTAKHTFSHVLRVYGTFLWTSLQLQLPTMLMTMMM